LFDSALIIEKTFIALNGNFNFQIRGNNMFRKNLTAILFLSAAFLIFVSADARAQDSVAAQSSQLTAAVMPKGAERLLPASVPAEFNQAFDKLLAQGAGKIAGGEREVLAWTGNYKNKANATRLVSELQTNFRAGGWQYESSGRNGDLEVFNLYQEGAPRRVILGFFVRGDEVLVCALMEVVKPGSSFSAPVAPKPIPTNVPNIQSSNGDSPAAASGEKIVLDMKRDQPFVNVMGSEMPAMPDFPKLAPKAGRARGYVKDSTGKPLAGAEIGVRSSYFAGQYSGAQGKTDASGYYEFVVPKGSAHYYNAGYQLNWGEGIAAVGLHPADGKLDSFTTMDGAVENFVLLPYGITSRENVSENPYVSSTYYGGTLHISYYTLEKTDSSRIAGSIVEDSIVEITLTPDGNLLGGAAGKTIVVRNPVGFRGNFSIHNIPLGRYKISAKVGGKSLNMKENRKFNPLFGMTPEETTGTATILFTPGSAKASMVSPQSGAWEGSSLTVSTS
jgi:hypothetical protein